MKRILNITVIISLILFTLFLTNRKQFVNLEDAVPGTEERGSFLKEENRLGDLQNSLANLLGALRQAERRDSSPIKQIEETGSISASRDSNWWLNSGGRISTLGSLGKTIQGRLDERDKWHREYLRNNPLDTDNGDHPQNIFRLVQRGSWGNLIQQSYFQINKLNLSSSPNRNASNGLFLFNRYQSGDDLYYTGIRVDGAVVIKKKLHGIYYTMAYKPIFDGPKYDVKNNPNLLPLNTWIGLRSEITNNQNGTVNIKLYTDINRTGNWTLALQAVDDGVNYGAAPITKPGFAGIRTDFMDVEFDGYSIRSVI
jgi:hypothetical protein